MTPDPPPWRVFYIHRTRPGREDWTRTTACCAGREAAAWRLVGWDTETVPTSPEVRARVRAWERAARGYPGETRG